MINILTTFPVVLSLFSLAKGAELFEDPFRIKIGDEPITLEHGYAYPTFVDLSGDGVKDLVLGSYAKQGRVNYFEASQGKSVITFAEGKYLEFSDRDGALYLSGVK